jgi:hypothetical protein
MRTSKPKMALALTLGALVLVAAFAASTAGFITRTPSVGHACSGGPAPDFGVTFETTDPNGRFTCIKPPSPEVMREIGRRKTSELLVELAPAIPIALAFLALVVTVWVARKVPDYS